MSGTASHKMPASQRTHKSPQPSGETAGQPKVEEMNLAAVQRVDGRARALVSTVPRVVLYQYENSSNTWERTSVEGTLFVYRRDVAPSHGFVLLNRLSSENLHELMETEMEFRVQGQFVLFNKHSDRHKIFGLCFSDAEVCADTGQLMADLSRGSVTNGHGSGRSHLISDMTSKSVPIIPASQTKPLSIPDDMREQQDRAFLNQGFSDNASSQESPPSDAITFSAPHNPAHIAWEDRTKATPSLHGPNGLDRKGVRSSAPQSIPLPQPLHSNPAHSQTVYGAPNSSHQQHRQQQHHHHQQQQGSEYSSAALQIMQMVGSPGRDEPSHSHAANEAKISNGVTPKQKLKPPQRASTAPGDTKSDQISTDSKKSRSRQTTSTNRNTPPSKELIHHTQPTPKQLFQTPPQTLAQEGGHSWSSTTPLSVQELFSQSLPSGTLAVLDPTQFVSSIQQMQPMSLKDIEKKMSEEVASPDKTPDKTPAQFALPAAASPSYSSEHTSRLSFDKPVFGGSRIPELLNPSAFSTSPTKQFTTPKTTQVPREFTTPETTQVPRESTTPTTTQVPREFTTPATTQVPREFTTPTTTHKANSSNHNGSTTPSHSTPHTELGTVRFSVEPPSPVTPQPTTAAQSRVFPPVPPLMHSPGMRAAPVQLSASRNDCSSSPLKRNTGRHEQGRGSRGGRERGSRGEGGKGGKVREGEARSVVRSTTAEKGNDAIGDRLAARSMSVPNSMSPLSAVTLPPPPSTHLTPDLQPPPSTQLLTPDRFSSSVETLPTEERKHHQPHLPQPPPQLQPLSRDQFKQAFLHLLQHNDDIIPLLHDAYQQSLSQPHR